MINLKLLAPKSIVVIGASNNIEKPGGKLLKNLLQSQFKGKVYVVNPKEDKVQGIKCHKNVKDLPQVDCAILAVAAKYCLPAVEVLANEKQTGGFIIISAGFSEENHEGAKIEHKIVKTINNVGGSLIGPNCTGFLNINYTGAFDAPIPKLEPMGVDFVTGSGATAVFIKELGITNGLPFNSVWAVGNSAQIGIEEVLEFWDETYDDGKSPFVKMIYMESIHDPKKLLKHASSLINKGCKIAAIKAGRSKAGSRAASSHTGAMATSDVAVDALFRKAGIVRCYNRVELINVCSVFMYPRMKGRNMAIITHAGGPAVMLTDVLSNNGINVPEIKGQKADELLTKLYPGSSVSNPIDFLATGTAEQLGHIIDACENDFNNIDGMAVIFGSPGLTRNWEVYNLIDAKMKMVKKTLYPIFPSTINVKEEVEDFINHKHHAIFPEESLFGAALTKVMNTPAPQPGNPHLPQVDTQTIREVIDENKNGYLPLKAMSKLLTAAGINHKTEIEVAEKNDAVKAAEKLGFPIVMKVVGPLHKSDVGGVSLNISTKEKVKTEFDRLIKIPETYAVEICPMYHGTELFIGANKDDKFGHQIMCGLGGIFIEVLKDVQVSLAPVAEPEALDMIRRLKGYKIIKGIRGQEPVNEELFAETVARVSALIKTAPEISEMDLNPLLGSKDAVVAVDARIRIEK